MKHKLMTVEAHLSFYCSKGTDCIDACVNFVGREWDRGLPVGTGNPLQRSVLHVQADGESYRVCVCVCLRERRFLLGRFYFCGCKTHGNKPSVEEVCVCVPVRI